MEKFYELFRRNLKTKRLELRVLAPTEENAKLLWDAVKNENPNDFKYSLIMPKSEQEALETMQKQDSYCQDTGVCWYIFHNNDLIGFQRIHYWESNKTLQFSEVWLVRSAWGKGFNKELHDFIEKIAFQDLKIHRATRQCMADNVRSKKSIERSGYHLDGRMRDSNLMPDGTWMDHLNFTKLETEYKG